MAIAGSRATISAFNAHGVLSHRASAAFPRSFRSLHCFCFLGSCEIHLRRFVIFACPRLPILQPPGAPPAEDRRGGLRDWRGRRRRPTSRRWARQQRLVVERLVTSAPPSITISPPNEKGQSIISRSLIERKRVERHRVAVNVKRAAAPQLAAISLACAALDGLGALPLLIAFSGIGA